MDPPVYLEKENAGSDANDKGKQEESVVAFIPGALVSFRNGRFVRVNTAVVATNADKGATTLEINTNDGGDKGGARLPILVLKN